MTDPLEEEDCPVGDKKNMVFAGSQITKGRGRCLVVATGMATELGKIAEAMERKATVKEKGFAAKWYKIKCVMGVAGTTPLQVKSVLFCLYLLVHHQWLSHLAIVADCPCTHGLFLSLTQNCLGQTQHARLYSPRHRPSSRPHRCCLDRLRRRPYEHCHLCRCNGCVNPPRFARRRCLAHPRHCLQRTRPPKRARSKDGRYRSTCKHNYFVFRQDGHVDAKSHGYVHFIIDARGCPEDKGGYSRAKFGKSAFSPLH